MEGEENLRMEWKEIAGMEHGKIVFHSITYHALVRWAFSWIN